MCCVVLWSTWSAHQSEQSVKNYSFNCGLVTSLCALGKKIRINMVRFPIKIKNSFLLPSRNWREIFSWIMLTIFLFTSVNSASSRFPYSSYVFHFPLSLTHTTSVFSVLNFLVLLWYKTLYIFCTVLLPHVFHTNFYKIFSLINE